MNLYVHLDLLQQPYFAADTVQISYEQHTEKNLRLDSRASVILAVIRLAGPVDKAEIYARINLSQQVILRYELFQYYYISSLTCFTLLSVNIAVLPGFFLFLLYHYYTAFCSFVSDLSFTEISAELIFF